MRTIILFLVILFICAVFAQDEAMGQMFEENSYMTNDHDTEDGYVETEAVTSDFTPFDYHLEAKQANSAKKHHPEVKWSELKDLLSLKTTGGASFHPRKREILFVSNKPGVLQLYTVNYDKNGKISSKPKRLLNTNNRCSSPRYLRDGSILFLHDRGGDENFQIGLIKPNGKLVWITNDLKSKHLPNTMSRKYFYFTSNTRDKKVLDIYRRKMPLTKNYKEPPQLIYTPSKGIARASLVAFDDSIVILEQHYNNLHSELLLLNLKTNKVQSITHGISGDKPTRWVASKFLKKDHSRLLVKTDFNSEFFRYAILEFPKGDLTQTPKVINIPELDKINHDFVGMHTNPRSKFSYLEINDNGYTVLLRLKITAKGVEGPIHKVNLPLKNSVIVHGDTRSFGAGLSISKDGKFIAMTLSNSVTPTAIWMMRLGTATKKAWQLLPNELPTSVARAKFIPETLNSINSFDGLKVPYFMWLPKGKAPAGGWPAIVHLHGGPESQTKPVFNALYQVFLRSGFAIVAPNIRGSRGYGVTYLNLDNREKRMDAIRDIKEVALSLSKKHPINEKKLVVMGGSYGGYASLMSVVSFPEVWKAGVDVVGMSNLITFFKHTAEWRRKLRTAKYGDYNTQKELLKQISPINHVDKVRCPVFIIQGSNDERVPASEAQQIYNKLQEVAKEPGKAQVAKSKLMIFKDEGHGLSKLKNRLVAYNKLLTWLRKNVQNN